MITPSPGAGVAIATINGVGGTTLSGLLVPWCADIPLVVEGS
jgi:hypothetical protein